MVRLFHDNFDKIVALVRMKAAIRYINRWVIYITHTPPCGGYQGNSSEDTFNPYDKTSFEGETT